MTTTATERARPDQTEAGSQNAVIVCLTQSADGFTFDYDKDNPTLAGLYLPVPPGWSLFDELRTSSYPTLLTGVFRRRRSSVQTAIEEIKIICGLTNEEIAPLAGVSRRSLQAWLAGEAISARKEQRLRELQEAVKTLRLTTPHETRDRLLQRRLGDIRLYDMLAEGRYAAARAIGLGQTPCTSAPAAPQAQPLLAQLNRHEGTIDLPREQLDRRFSRRLRR